MEMTFQEVVLECRMTPEFVKEFNRLSGCKLGIDNRAPITKMIDEATGYQTGLDKQESWYMQQFIGFVFACIWLPLAARAEGRQQ